MLEVDGLVGLLLLGFWIWALLDVIATDAGMCRNLPKGMWLLIVLILPDIGAIAWLLLGRPERASWRPGSTDYAAPRAPVGPEDEPRYSSSPSITDRRSQELDEQLATWERDQAKSRQDDLDRRELELQRRELELRERELETRERKADDES